MILGITGGTGSGKTTLLQAIQQAGGLILDCDAIYHDLLKTDKALLAAIDSRFPGCITDGILDRKQLGTIVFADPAALQDLNAITHSAIKARVRQALEAKPQLAAIDAIALFESGLSQLCDVTVAVIADPEIRVQRLMARDGITAEYAKNRIAAQPDNAYFCAVCDHTLENNGTAEDFQKKAFALLAQLGIIKETETPI